MIPIKTNTKSVTLTGEEIHLHFSSAYSNFWVRNDGSGTLLMSLSPNISEGKDGVIEVPAGSSAGTMHGFEGSRNDLYLLGSGKVQVMGTFSADSPFKTAGKGGEGNAGIKLGGLVEHTTGSAGWYIKTDGCSASEKVPEHHIVYYAVAEGLSIYIKAEDDGNDCKFIWSKSNIKDVTSSYPNKSLVGEPITNTVNGIVIVPKEATFICFSQRIDDNETGVYTLLS